MRRTRNQIQRHGGKVARTQVELMKKYVNLVGQNPSAREQDQIIASIGLDLFQLDPVEVESILFGTSGEVRR